ncbi:MAG: DUF4139 domain-containing protein [Bacteroidota bacterium]|nr:DUF4139 domain-containing protein [Bacteroidota bacterium]
MKRLVLFGTLLLWFVLSFGQKEIKSNMDKVTIYPYKALIEKSVKVNLQKGENKFIITNNATNISLESVHFSSSDNWFITSVNTQIQTLPEKEAAKKSLPQNIYQQYLVLKDKLDKIEFQITDNESYIKNLNTQKTALSNLKAIKNPAEIDSVSVLKSQFSFQREEAKNINELLSKAITKKEELNYQKNTTTREIESLIKKYVGGKKILTKDNYILVSVYANKDTQDEVLRYSYNVYGVQSIYSYDVMLEEERNSAVFYLNNTISQNTGENWKDCEIVFSTSEGEYAGYDEELPPYYLDFVDTKPTNNSRLMQNVVLSVKSSGSKQEESAMEVADLSIYSSQSSMQDLTLNREYSLATKQNIATNEEALTIPLYNEKTRAEFSRFATPKNAEKVFYTALLPEWEDLGLLDTECDIYLNNRFVSNYFINTIGTGDTMRFAIGEDKNIRVTRKMRRETPSSSGFLSKSIEEKAQITITIKNTKNENIELSLKDQIPISSNSEIKISNILLDGGALDNNTGEVRWNISLEPKQERKITFSYMVTYPKGQKIILN